MLNLDSFHDPNNDNDYLNLATQDIKAILQGRVIVDDSLLERITSLTIKHLQKPETSINRLKADISLLQGAISAHQKPVVLHLPTLAGDVKATSAQLQKNAENTLQALELRQWVEEQLDPQVVRCKGHEVRTHADFSLINADFMHVEHNMGSKDALALMVGSLKAIRHKLPAGEQVKVDMLLEKFQCAGRVDSLVSKLVAKSTTRDDYSRNSQALQQALTSRLNRGEPLYLSSGWSGRPFGHHITLELTPTKQPDGTITVSGRIQNRGAGVHHHPLAVKGTKFTSDPEIILRDIPLDALKNSPFFNRYFQLQFVDRPKDPHFFNPQDNLSTGFDEGDFYDVLLPAWPGGLAFPKAFTSRTNQRGGTCSIKPLMTETQSFLGNEIGELAKFYMTEQSWKTFMTHVGVTPENALQLKSMISKFSRRAVKLKRRGLLSISERREVNALCQGVRRQIKAVLATENARLSSTTTPIDTPSVQAGGVMQIPFAPVAVAQMANPILESNASEPTAVNLVRLQRTFYQHFYGDNQEAALEAFHEILRTIPNASHVAFWSDPENHALIKFIAENQPRMFRDLGAKTRSLTASPEIACLRVKVLAIAYQIAKTKLPNNLTQLYARQLRSLIQNQLPALFCPLNPVDLAEFRESIALIIRDANGDNPFSISQDFMEQPNSWVGQLPFSATGLRGALTNPELAHLYKMSRNKWPWNEKSNMEKELWDLTALGNFFRDCSVEDDQEYVFLRDAFLLTSISLNLRATVIDDTPVILHLSNLDGYQLIVSHGVNNVKLHHPERYNQGIFADVFAGFGDTRLTEVFATDLLSRTRMRVDMRLPFSHQSMLSTFSIPELGCSPLFIQNLFSARTVHALPLPQIEHCFSGTAATPGIWALEEPLHQSLFMLLLFKVDENTFLSPLEQACDRRPASHEIANFFSFLNTSLRQVRETQSWNPYFFLLRIYAISLSQCSHHQGAIPLDEQFATDFESELDRIASEKVRRRLDGAQQASFNDCLESMVPYLATVPAYLPLIHRFQAIRKLLAPQPSQQAQRTDLHLERDRITGRFILENRPEFQETDAKKNATTLPDSVTGNDLYITLFGFERQTTKEDPPNSGRYEFVDSSGITYRIQVGLQAAIRIFGLFPDAQNNLRWYHLQKESLFAGDESNPPLSTGGTLRTQTLTWVAVEGPEEARVVSRKNGGLLCYVYPDHIGHPKSSAETLVSDYSLPIVNELARLTQKTEMLAWKNARDGQLTQVDLVEFDLHFKQVIDDQGKVRWASSQHEGYYLDPHSKIPVLEPFPHYLVLINDDGQRKVIMPAQRFVPGVMHFPHKSSLEKWGNMVEKLFTYDLTADGQIALSTDPLKLQYLIYLGLEKQDYSLGFQALHAMKRHLEPWDESMILMMQYFELSTPSEIDKWNHHPEAAALRLSLKTALVAQPLATLTQVQKDFLKKDYLLYLNQLNNVPAYQRLSVEEELRLQQKLSEFPLADYEKIILDNRSAVLRHLPTTQVPPGREARRNPEANRLAISHDWHWIDAEMTTHMVALITGPLPQSDENFALRPGVDFLHHFLQYYNILKESPSEPSAQAVKQLIIACRHDPEPRIQCIRGLLTAVARDPAAFPALDQLMKGPDLVATLIKLTTDMAPVIELSSFDHAIGHAVDLAVQAGPPTLGGVAPAPQPITPAVFEDIPDTLAITFMKKGMVQERLPNDGDLAGLRDKVGKLREIRRFYHGLARDAEPSKAPEFSRIVEGLDEVIRETTEQIAVTDAIMCANDLSQTPIESRVLDFPSDQLDGLIEHLIFKGDSDRNALAILRDEIQTNLNTYDFDDRVMEMYAGLYAPLSFEEALIHFGRGDDTPFYRANPDLTEKTLKKLKKSLGRYLLHQANSQKGTRLLNQLTALRDISVAKGENIADYRVAKAHAIQTLQEHRAYNPHEAPHLLVYECFTDLCLRKEQLTALNQLAGGETTDNLIFEARTGFGKSKALIPLWLHLTARRRSAEATPGIAMMTVPAPLFEQQVAYLKKVLGGAFDQSVFAFRFNREQGNNLAYLKQLNAMLDRAAAQGMCVLTTVDSLHGALDLKIKELADKELTDDNLALLTELRALRHKAKTQLSNFFDESRECFDIRTYYDYAIGKLDAIPCQTREAVGNLYTLLLDLDPPIPVDFLAGESSGELPPLTEERYDAEVKGRLADVILNQLMRSRALPATSQSDGSLLLRLLKGDYDSAIDEYLDALTPDQLRTLELYHDQLNIYLPRTLTRQCNGRYGLATEQTNNRQAYPFDRGVPKLSSEFSSPHDLLNFTLQANLKTPFTHKDLQTFIQSIKIGLEKAEDKDDFKRRDSHYRCYLALTQAVQPWPTKLANCTSADINRLLVAINAPNNTKLRLRLITDYVLPQIAVYNEKISSTAHNIVEAMQRLYGASGTVNTDTLSPRLQTIEHPSTPVGTLLALWTHSQDAIHVVSNQEASVLLTSTIKNLPNCNVIVDVANSFRDLRDERQIAEIIFAATAERTDPPVQAVSYYDKHGSHYVLMRPKAGEVLGLPIRREHCSVPVESIFVFMRQSAAVGSDTPMTITAQMIVTLESETQRDLFLQGIGRARGLQTGQKVHFLIQEKDAHAFADHRGRVTLKSILALVGKNQAKQREQDVVFNLGLLLQNLVEARFWEPFDDPNNSIYSGIAMYRSLQSFFVEGSVDNPLRALKQRRGEVPMQTVVEQMKEALRYKCRAGLDETALNAIFAAFDQLVDYTRLPKTIHTGSFNEANREVAVVAAAVADRTQEAVAAQQLQADQSQQSQRERTTASALPKVRFTAANPEASAHYRTLGLTETSQASAQFPKPFSKVLADIHGSTNYFRIAAGGLWNRAATRPKDLLMAAYQHLIVCERGTFQVVLMEQQDTEAVLGQMARARDMTRKNYYLMSSSGKVIVQDAADDFDYLAWERHPRLTFLTKVFSQNWNFSTVERDYLRSLEPQAKQQVFDFLKNHIANCWPPFAPVLAELMDT